MKLCRACNEALGEDPKQLRCTGACFEEFHYQCVISSESLDLSEIFFWQCANCREMEKVKFSHEESLKMGCGIVMCELNKLERVLSTYDEVIARGNRDDGEVARMFRIVEATVCNMRETYNCLHQEVEEEKAEDPADDQQGQVPEEPVPMQTPALDWKLLTKIFEQMDVKTLCQARLVSRHWFRIIKRTPSLMAKFALSFPVNTFLDANCEPSKILPTSKSTYRTAKLAHLTIPDVGSWCPATLQTLSLHHCVVSLETLLRLLRALPVLQKLTFTSGHFVECVPSPHVNFRLRELRELVLLDIVNPAVVNFFRLLRPPLRVLEVPQQVTGESPLAEGLFQLVAVVYETLEELRVGVAANWWCQMIAVRKLRLTKFCVVGDHFEGIGEEELITKISAQRQIEHLELGGVSSKTLYTIGCKLPNLRRLRVHFQTGSSHKAAFLNTMPKLRHLTLISSCGLSLDLSLCQQVSQVHILILEGVYPGPSFHNVFPNVRHLKLQGRTNSPAAPQYWAEVFGPIGRLKNLQSAELHNVQVQQTVLHTTATYLDSLQRLHLANCDMSEQQLTQLVLLGRKLKEVSLDGMTHVTQSICQEMERPGLRVVRIPPKENSQREARQQQVQGSRANPSSEGQQVL